MAKTKPFRKLQNGKNEIALHRRPAGVRAFVTFGPEVGSTFDFASEAEAIVALSGDLSKLVKAAS